MKVEKSYLHNTTAETYVYKHWGSWCTRFWTISVLYTLVKPPCQEHTAGKPQQFAFTPKTTVCIRPTYLFRFSATLFSFTYNKAHFQGLYLCKLNNSTLSIPCTKSNPSTFSCQTLKSALSEGGRAQRPWAPNFLPPNPIICKTDLRTPH